MATENEFVPPYEAPSEKWLREMIEFFEAQRRFHELAEKMMDEEPLRRPSMQDAVREIMDYHARSSQEHSIKG